MTIEVTDKDVEYDDWTGDTYVTFRFSKGQYHMLDGKEHTHVVLMDRDRLMGPRYVPCYDVKKKRFDVRWWTGEQLT